MAIVRNPLDFSRRNRITLIPPGLVHTRGLVKLIVVSGYGSHHWEVSSLPASESQKPSFAVTDIMQSHEPPFGGHRPVKDVWVRGHSDREWLHGGRNTQKELQVSRERAQDVFDDMMKTLAPWQSPIGVVVRFDIQAIGAHELLKTEHLVNPENRRVEIALFDERQPDWL